jgi:hypothetical protein
VASLQAEISGTRLRGSREQSTCRTAKRYGECCEQLRIAGRLCQQDRDAPADDPQDCAGFGNSHWDSAIKSTGQTQAGDALRILDPSVTVTH